MAYEYYEIIGNMLDYYDKDDRTWLVQCISSDFKLNKFDHNLAKEFNNNFKTRQLLCENYQKTQFDDGPKIFLLPNLKIINICTKKYYYKRPILDDMTKCFKLIRDEMLTKYNIKTLVIPYIGTSLDEIKISQIKGICSTLFKNNHIDIKIIMLRKVSDSKLRKMKEKGKI